MRWMFTLFCLAVWCAVDAQSVGIGTSSPDTTAQLDISSSSRGLLIPRMPYDAVYTLKNPAQGLMFFDTTYNRLLVNIGTPAQSNWATIDHNTGWVLGGNTGGLSRGFGTQDNTPINFMANGKSFGILNPDTYDVAFGPLALSEPYPGSSGNIALGYQSIEGGASACVALGPLSLSNGGSTCFYDVAIGNWAMAGASGHDCIALGDEALGQEKGAYNVGLGYATFLNSRADNNIGIGTQAGNKTTTGSDNIAIGQTSFLNNTTGEANVAVGSMALNNSTTAWYNTAVGYNSGEAYDNGYNNVFLGANNDVNGAGYYNVIAIGQAVICTASDQARIGNPATNSIGGYANWTNFSDGRYKRNIRENVKGLDFIMRLRPITYNLDVTGIRNHLREKAPTDAGTQQSITARETEVFSGFAAQEVEAAAAAAGYNFSGVDKPKNANDFYGLRYGDFVAPLVKAVQEQQQMIEELQKEVGALKKQIQH